MNLFQKENRVHSVLFVISFMAVIAVLIGCYFYQTNEWKMIEESYQHNLIQMAGIEAGENAAQKVMDLLKDSNQGQDENIVQAEIQKGKEILGQYGYTEDFSDRSKRQPVVYLAGCYACIFAVFSASAAFLFYQMKMQQSKRFEKISEVLEEFMNGNYHIQTRDLLKENHVFDQIRDQLERLGSVISFSNDQLWEEKENTKALVTDLSHQLKTPLASLKTCFTLLTEEELLPNEQEEFLERSKEQVSRLEGLVAALVNISRLEAGMVMLHPERADFKETIIRAVDLVYWKAEMKKIEIEMEEMEPIFITHDPKWTAEAISNILDNAIKYSREKTTISIGSVILPSFVRLDISDQGIGIPKEEYNNVFKRFYRGKSSIVKSSEGSGVGLYLAREILERQSGNIKAVSRREGGTTFVLQFCKTV